ncbi:MAG: tetratricopeptide repeat protein [Candidatus Hermodarchaeota archaeon]
MVETNLTLKDLLEEGYSFNIIAGAGCSIDAPSSIPASNKLMEEIINFSCANSEIENILKIDGLRFEILLEIIRSLLDKELKILEYLELFEKPNIIHFYLAEMIYRGFNVITTNFDFLIEHAIIQSNKKKDSIVPVIIEDDFRHYENINDYLKEDTKFLFKIHGSTKDILQKRDTREYFLSLIKKIGSYKTEFNLFFVEPYKGVLLNKLFNKSIALIIGYSGENDYDIVPILKRYHKWRRIIWINHIENNGDKEIITKILKTRDRSTKDLDSLDTILLEIKYQNPHIELYRIDTNIKKSLKRILNFEPTVDQNDSAPNFSDWLHNNIDEPNQMIKYLIPHVIYFNFDRLEDSFRCGIRALENIDKDSRNSHKLLVLNNIAWIYYKMGNYSEAIEYFEEATKIAHELGKKSQELIYLSNLGEIYERIRNFPLAIQKYEEAMKIAEDSGNSMEKLRIMNSVIEIYEELQDYSRALLFSGEAIKISEKLGDLKKKALILNNIGSIYFKENNLELALEYFQQAEKIFRRLNDIENLIICLNNIGTIFQKLSDFSIALYKFEEALSYDERLKNKKGKAQHLSKIGEVYFDQSDYIKALDFFSDAIKIFQEIKYIKGEMELLNWLGKTFFYLKEYNNALNSYQNGLKIAEELNDLSFKADFLNNIAGSYYMQLNYKESYKYAQESLLTLRLMGLGKSIKALTLEKKILNIKSLIKL